MSRDSLIGSTMFTYYWTAEACGELLADSSELILPGDTVVKVEPHFATFSDVSQDGIPLKWLWLFPDAEQAMQVVIIGTSPSFQNLGNFQDLIQRSIPPKVGTTAKTKLLEIDPEIFNHVPNLQEEIGEVWIGFDANRLWRDFNPRVAALDVLSVEEFLERLKRRIV